MNEDGGVDAPPGTSVARGHDCPLCATAMQVTAERHYRAGAKIIYACPTCGHDLDVFEDR